MGLGKTVQVPALTLGERRGRAATAGSAEVNLTELSDEAPIRDAGGVSDWKQAGPLRYRGRT